MLFYWQFDACAATIATLLLLEIFRNKDLKNRKNRCFLFIVYSLFISSLADLPGVFMMNNPEFFRPVVADIFISIFLIANNVAIWFYMCYVVALLRLNLNKHPLSAIILMMPETLMIIGMFIEPFRRQIFYFTDGNIYNRGPLYPLFYFLTAYYVLVGIFLMTRYHKAMDRKQIHSFIYFTSLCIISSVIQGFFPRLKWALFFQATGLLIAFLTIENESAIRSPRTGLYNRYAFSQDAEQLFNLKISATVLSVNIPTIRSVKYALGRASTENIFKNMADYIAGLLPMDWYAYELDDDKFTIIAYQPKASETEMLAESLRARFSNPWDYESGSIGLPAEIIICQVPDKVADLEQLMIAIDANQNRIRRRTHVEYSDIYDKQKYSARVELALRNALKNNSLMVYYQPIFDTASGNSHSAEALIRLKDPGLGFISPEFFVPLAEKLGLINEIGDFVFEEVCRFLRNLRDQNSILDIVEVNLSAVQCMDQALPSRWSGILEKYQIPSSAICLELTETAMSSSLYCMNQTITSLREMGFTFALDDYGTGYSNNAYIMEFPFELIKIDKSMLWGADKNLKTDKMLLHTISMVNDLGMGIVVEGVETEAHKEKLTAYGANFMQGYYFSKPVPKEEAAKYFAGQL